ncbi:MAG TPA: response regulator [Bacteroidota bacterium]
MKQDPINVLMVEDDPAYAASVKQTLLRSGEATFTVTHAASREECFLLFPKSPTPQIVLVDYWLPDSTGVVIAKELLEKKVPAPIILLTSDREFGTAVEALKVGLFDYLVKDQLPLSMIPRTLLSLRERYDLRRKLEELQAERDRLETIQRLSATLHDHINNSLGTIRLAADILRTKDLKQGQREQHCDTIFNQVQKIVEVLQKLKLIEKEKTFRSAGQEMYEI